MALKPFSFRKLAFRCSNLLHKHLKSIPKRKNYSGFQTFQLLNQRAGLENHVIIFHMEKTLLKSPSLFPYFLLVAFEAGSFMRALIFFILYPFIISLCSKDLALEVMVFLCFVGVKKDSFKQGRAVLPKFFLEDVGKESFEVLRKGKIKLASSDLPRVWVESFLIDYLDVDFVYGKELKVFRGYYTGFMEKPNESHQNDAFHQVMETSSCNGSVIGITSLNTSFDNPLFSHCKEIYLVGENERRNWSQLPRNSYPKPLIFHDGRLAFKPTYFATLAMFMWLPLGFILAIFRTFIFIALPNEIKRPILQFTGAHLTILKPPPKVKGKNGILYVCNHKTLLDPLILSYCITSSLTALTYSLSRVSEFLSPIKTVRLTRNRAHDSELMHEVLTKGDLVICPEGTTCREPYLLRFSPLFSEVSENIMPVAMDCHVSMFYGTSTGGFKCLDPLFFLMNPTPSYSVSFLDVVCGKKESDDSKFRVANLVQSKIANELEFTCTKLTRKDKYLILAGNEGIV